MRLRSKALFEFTLTAFLSVFTYSPLALTEPLEVQFEIIPRLDAWQTGSDLKNEVKRELYLRSALDGTIKHGLTSFRSRIEGFATTDLAEKDLKPLGSPDIRRTRDEADLNEAWLDITNDFFGIRIGRQPIRWSQSWTLPSLDILSGRRFNRLFLDPLLDQLTHPDALRLTKSGKIFEQVYELDLVRVLKSAPVRFAEPVPNQDREDRHETAIRATTKFELLEVAILASHRFDKNSDPRLSRDVLTSGVLTSYAFEDFVLKAEAGNVDRDAMFFVIGSDWFLDSWLIGPQITVFRDSYLGNESGEAIAYLPIRYNDDKWSIEFDILKGFASPSAADDLFFSTRFGYEFLPGLAASVGAQTYHGQTGRLLGQAQNLTGGTTIGLRVEYTGGLLL